MGMTRSTPPQRAPRPRTVAAEIENLERRLAAIEDEQYLLRNTLCGLARENGITVGGVCSDCNRSYVLIERGMLYCPKCRTQRAT